MDTREALNNEEKTQWIIDHYSGTYEMFVDPIALYDRINELEALNQPQPTADVVEKLCDWLYYWMPTQCPDGMSKIRADNWHATQALLKSIAALPQQPSLPQGMTEENVRLFNDAMTLITKSLAGMLTDNSFASPYPEDHRPTTPRWVIAKFAHDHDRRVAYVNDIKQRLDWIRNATESVRIRALSALPGNSVKGVEWQSIETAPKDGTQFIAFHERAGRVICQWHPADYFKDGGAATWFPVIDPILWQPLPLPPASTDTALAEKSTK